MYLFQPQGRFMRKWNLLLVLLMLFTAVVTPYEVAFLSSGPTEPIFWVDRVVDFLFFIDIFVTMNLVYFDERSHHLIQDRDAIMRKCVHVRVRLWCAVSSADALCLALGTRKRTSCGMS